MELSKKEEKEHAQLLYVNDRVSFREIATRVKVSERTISRWAREGNWDKLRKSLLATKENQLVAFYNQLEALNEEIEHREKKIPTNLEADIMSKITSNIYKLEGEMVMNGKSLSGSCKT
ncbi:MAG: DDE transposase family protein [Bergeyella sp.]|nr:DDE transposase family protein [Bergeyella sp.]